MKKITLAITFITISALIFSCTKEEAAPVIPKTTFADISKITAISCVPCHLANSGANFDARKKHVDNYSITKENATIILDRITRDPSAAGFMPRGKPKLSDAEIELFKKWIGDGLLEK
jgi:hypothetical protein